MSETKIFPDGMIVKRRDNAPDFVVCNISIKLEEFIPFLQANAKNGWVNLNVKTSKAGNMYSDLDTFTPTSSNAQNSDQAPAPAAKAPEPKRPVPPQDIDDPTDDLPF